MFKRLLERIARALDAAGVAYMVIGGQAVLLYGEPRLTKDIDITLGADLDALRTVVALAEQLALTPLVEAETFTRETMVLPCQDDRTGIRVDFIFSCSPYEQQALERVRRVNLGSYPVRFAAPEDIVIHKIIAGRPRDLEDVKSILMKNPAVDQKYIGCWLREYATVVDEPLLERFEKALKESR